MEDAAGDTLAKLGPKKTTYHMSTTKAGITQSLSKSVGGIAFLH